MRWLSNFCGLLQIRLNIVITFYTSERSIDFLSAPFQVDKGFFRCVQFEPNRISCEGALGCNKRFCWVNIRHTFTVETKVVSTTVHSEYTPWAVQLVFPFCATSFLREATSCMYQEGLWERISSLATPGRTEWVHSAHQTLGVLKKLSGPSVIS